jgi:hypothetical protein
MATLIGLTADMFCINLAEPTDIARSLWWLQAFLTLGSVVMRQMIVLAQTEHADVKRDAQRKFAVTPQTAFGLAIL